MSRDLVKQIFRLSLQKDPIKRCGDVSKLPFTSGKHSNMIAELVNSSLIGPPDVQAKWSFEVHSPASGRFLVDKCRSSFRTSYVCPDFLIRRKRRWWLMPKQRRALRLERIKLASHSISDSPMALVLVLRRTWKRLSWIAKSAAQGSPAVSLFLEVIKDHEELEQKVLHALRNITEGLAHSTGQGACRFSHQDSEAVDLSSFSSTDGCNPLHYLSLFEGLTNPESSSREKGLDVLKRTDFESPKILAERSSPNITSHLRSGLERDEYRKGKVSDLSLRVRRLSKVVKLLGPQFIYASTAKLHHLYQHFPMTLSGTPLSFAITLDCREATEALLYEIQRFSGKVFYEKLGLETAVSCHRSEIFSFIWSICLKITKDEDLFDAIFSSKKELHLIAALATKSSLERTVLHGSNRSLAQTNMIKSLIASLNDLASKSHRGHETAVNAAFEKLVGEEMEEILELGDLDVAIELRRTIRSQTPDDPCGQGVFDAAMNVACSGHFDLGRSKDFVKFAQDCQQDLNPDFQALKTLIDYRSEALFQSCVEGGITIDGCDEHGQDILHHMISTNFYTSDSLNLVISRGVDLNHPNSEGQTPLHLAAKLGLPLVVEDLLANGAVPLFADKNGASILVYAVAAHNVTVVTKVLEALQTTLQDAQNDISGSKFSPSGQHLFSWDAFGSIYEDESIYQNHIKRGKTVLHIAASNGDAEIVRLLLSYGASPELADEHGNTALHHAILGNRSCRNDTVSSCQFLLEALSEKLPLNKDGETPLHLAVQQWEGDSLRDLLTSFITHHGCNVDVQNARGETLLHKAASQISVSSVTTLLSFGAGINQKDSRGRTATHHFAHAACFVWRQSSSRHHRIQNMLETLIKASANLLLRDYTQCSGGDTAMEYAAINGNYALFRSMSEIACQRFKIPHNHEVSKQWMSSAWSLSITEEQWHMVRQLLLQDPVFDVDLFLLKWPKGVRLLKYAVAVDEEDLLSRFSMILSPEPKTDTWRAMTPKYSDTHWSSSQINSWEKSIDCTEVHKGGDPLHEIFQFMLTLDWQTEKPCFQTANRERRIANENGFQWESLINEETLDRWNVRTKFHAQAMAERNRPKK